MSAGQSMHTSSNGALHATKKVQKNRNNYASVECGAKILAANPEAKVLEYKVLLYLQELVTLLNIGIDFLGTIF